MGNPGRFPLRKASCDRVAASRDLFDSACTSVRVPSVCACVCVCVCVCVFVKQKERDATKWNQHIKAKTKNVTNFIEAFIFTDTPTES